MYSVVNQDGNYIHGYAYDMIVSAYQKDKTSLTIDGYSVFIVSARYVDGVTTIRIIYER